MSPIPHYRQPAESPQQPASMEPSTEAKAPPVAPAQPADLAPAPARVDSTYAWTLAVVPLLSPLLVLGLPELSVGVVVLIVVVVNGALALLDHQRLERVGIQVSAAAAVLLVPLYLVLRTKAAKSTPAIPLVWVGAFVVSLVLTNLTSPVELDGDRIEQQIERALERQAGSQVTVLCPSAPRLNVDESFTCWASADRRYQVFVTLTDRNGYVTWVVGR